MDDRNSNDPYRGARFPLSTRDLENVAAVVELVRSQLRRMKPAHIRAASALLLSLERLPAATDGVRLSFRFEGPTVDGVFAWADITISAEVFCLGAGEHVHDPLAGRNAAARMFFLAYAGARRSDGAIEDWLTQARVISDEDCIIQVEDHSDDAAVDWDCPGTPGPIETCGAEATTDTDASSTHSPDELRRIFEEASAPVSDHLREQLAYRHMIALADSFEGWALDRRMTPEQSVKLVGWSEAMRALAEDVGPDWNPPTPDRDNLTLMGFLGRQVLGES